MPPRYLRSSARDRRCGIAHMPASGAMISEQPKEALTMTSPYPWPVEPFDRQHPVRAYFNDPRIQDASHAFHFGIDVSAPDGTAVYAVAPGTVYIEDKGHAVAVLGSNGRSHSYW